MKKNILSMCYYYEPLLIRKFSIWLNFFFAALLALKITVCASKRLNALHPSYLPRRLRPAAVLLILPLHSFAQ